MLPCYFRRRSTVFALGEHGGCLRCACIGARRRRRRRRRQRRLRRRRQWRPVSASGAECDVDGRHRSSIDRREVSLRAAPYTWWAHVWRALRGETASGWRSRPPARGRQDSHWLCPDRPLPYQAPIGPTSLGPYVAIMLTSPGPHVSITSTSPTRHVTLMPTSPGS